MFYGFNFMIDNFDNLNQTCDYYEYDYKYDYKEELIIYRQYLRDLPNVVEKNILDYYNTKNKRTSLIEKFNYNLINL